jgi:hypothetical protein
MLTPISGCATAIDFLHHLLVASSITREVMWVNVRNGLGPVLECLTVTSSPFTKVRPQRRRNAYLPAGLVSGEPGESSDIEAPCDGARCEENHRKKALISMGSAVMSYSLLQQTRAR